MVGGGGEAEDEGLQGCGSDEVKDGAEEQERAAGGEFVLLSARALHRLGGFHQVASTLHSSGVTEVSLFCVWEGSLLLVQQLRCNRGVSSSIRWRARGTWIL